MPPGEDPYTHLGKGLDVYDRIQEAADKAEAQNAAQSAKAGIDGAIKIANADEADPDVFKNKSVQSAQQIYQTAVDGARNPRVRELIENRLKDDLINASTDIHLAHKQKQVGVALGNSFTYLQQAERELSQMSDPAEIQKKETEIAGHIRDMVQLRALSPLQAQQQIQGIKERDAFTRAYREVDISRDPMATIAEVQKRLPNLDPAKIPELMRHGDTRQREMERLQEKAEKKVHEENVLLDTIDASNGKLTLPDLDARARARRYTPAEYNTIRNTMEQGGVTDPRVSTQLEQQIREGRLTDYSVIANHPGLDRAEKSRLMGLVQSAKDEKHFSNQPPYKEAAKELRLAATRKGPMESLDPKEQQVLLSADKELYDRAGRGEDPMQVSRDIQARITPATQADKPLFTPRYQKPEDLVRDLKAGRITRDDFDSQALLLKQWQQYTERLQQKAQQPTQPSKSSQERRR